MAETKLGIRAFKNMKQFPKWLQEYVYDLERQILKQDKKIKFYELVDKDEVTDICYELPFDNACKKTPLPHRTRIVFYFDDNDIRRNINVMKLDRDGKEVIEIMGGSSITLEPRASNVIWIHPKEN